MTPTDSTYRGLDPEPRQVDVDANRKEQLRRRKVELEYERRCHKRWLVDRVLWDGPAVSRYNAMMRADIQAELDVVNKELGLNPRREAVGFLGLGLVLLTIFAILGAFASHRSDTDGSDARAWAKCAGSFVDGSGGRVEFYSDGSSEANPPPGAVAAWGACVANAR